MNSVLRAFLTTLVLAVFLCVFAAWLGLGMILIFTASDGSVLAGFGAAGWFFIMIMCILWMLQN